MKWVKYVSLILNVTDFALLHTSFRS